MCVLSALEEGVRVEVGTELGRTRSWLLGEQRPLSKERREDFPGERGDLEPSRPDVCLCSWPPLVALRQQRLLSRVGPRLLPEGYPSAFTLWSMAEA